MVVLHLVLGKNLTDISGTGLFEWFNEKSNFWLCAEHDPDDVDDPKGGRFNKVHCHVMIEISVSVEVVRKVLTKCELAGRGQYAIMTKTQKTREPYDMEKLCIYILKGRLKPISRGFMESEIERYRTLWVEREEKVESREKKNSSGEKREKTHWDLIDEIWNELCEMPVWDVRLDFDPTGSGRTLNSVGRDAAWQLMLKKLHENKVRTSRNELERFYVTLIRRDYGSSVGLKESIFKNVFR